MAELQRLLQQNGTFESELVEAFLTAAQVSFREPQRNHSNDNQKNNQPVMTGTSESGSLTDNANSNFQPLPDAASPFQMPELSPEMMPDMIGMMDNDSRMTTMMSGMMSGAMSANMPISDDNANEIDVERILEEVKQGPSALRKQLMEQVITTAGDAHMATVRPTYASVAEANERIKKVLECGLPDMSKLNINPSHMWQKFVQSMVYEITQVVKFCKKLPGFGEIQQEDQIVLIKKGSFEVMLCRMCLLIDHVKQEMLDPNMEMKCPRAIVKKMPMGPFIDEFFTVASQMNPIKLTDEEIGIFSAALIMCPDREGLSNVLAVEKLNTLFLQSLYVEMRMVHTDFEDKFARLLSIIPVFKNLNKKHSMTLNSIKMQNEPVASEFPPLHREIYDN